MVEATCPVTEREPRIGALQRLELVIKTARARPYIPPILLGRADEVIE